MTALEETLKDKWETWCEIFDEYIDFESWLDKQESSALELRLARCE